MVDFLRMMTPEARQRVLDYREWYEERKIGHQKMTDTELIEAARNCVQNMSPIRWAPGEPVYDATFFHVILPELLSRLAGEEVKIDA